jgi:hypothetical protein
MAITSAGAPVSDPGNKTALECFGVEHCENIAEVIVGGRAVAKRQEPAEKAELLVAEARDIGEGLGPSQHRQQAKHQHFPQRIHDLPLLAGIGQAVEIVKKNTRFA